MAFFAPSFVLVDISDRCFSHISTYSLVKSVSIASATFSSPDCSPFSQHSSVPQTLLQMGLNISSLVFYGSGKVRDAFANEYSDQHICLHTVCMALPPKGVLDQQ